MSDVNETTNLEESCVPEVASETINVSNDKAFINITTSIKNTIGESSEILVKRIVDEEVNKEIDRRAAILKKGYDRISELQKQLKKDENQFVSTFSVTGEETKTRTKDQHEAIKKTTKLYNDLQTAFSNAITKNTSDLFSKLESEINKK